MFTTWSYSIAKLQMFFIILTGNSFRFLLSPASVNISAHTLFAVCCKFEVLVLGHAHFEGCPFLKTDICPFQKTAKFSVALLTTVSIFRNLCRLIQLLQVPYHRFMIKLSDNRFENFLVVT